MYINHKVPIAGSGGNLQGPALMQQQNIMMAMQQQANPNTVSNAGRQIINNSRINNYNPSTNNPSLLNNSNVGGVFGNNNSNNFFNNNNNRATPTSDNSKFFRGFDGGDDTDNEQRGPYGRNPDQKNNKEFNSPD